MSAVDADGGRAAPLGTLYDSMTDDVPEDAEDARLARGTPVDRYVVLHELGSGGMGVVYSAYDPELDRRVALKVLQSKVRGTRARNRLMREAKAIAKLSHPNVVTVHDVGTVEGRVFIAMEYIDGVTLRRWIRRSTPGNEEIIRALVAAGRGLAAAHAADLVHRDFKPDNILVEPSGRVVVLDFGLARRSRSSDGDARVSSSVDESVVVSDSVDELGLHLTKTGARLGTPAYMAPEQHLGKETDARTDQFAFCVVLWEALYGVRPFSGRSARGTALRVIKGKLDEPPRGTSVASWVRKILARGLSPLAADRYPSMEVLLRELVRAPARRKRVALVAGGAVTVAALSIAGAVLWGANTDSNPCESGDQRWDGVWDADRGAELAAGFERTGAPFAVVASRGVSSVLDQYTQGWVVLYRDACEATEVHHEQSREMLDLRMACLRNRRADASALIEELMEPDIRVVEHAVEGVRSLPRLEACSNVEALSAGVSAPRDPVTAQKVEQMRGRLSDALGKEAAGRYAEALGVIEGIEGPARELAYPPILAEVNLRRGSVLERQGDFAGAEEALLEAIWGAKGAHHADVEAEAWVRLVWVSGVERHNAERGRTWSRFAQAALESGAPDPVLDATLAHNIAGVLYREERFEESLALYREALSEQRRLLGRDDPRVAMTLNHIGNVLMQQEQYAWSREYCERSLKVREETLGTRHPKVAASLNNLGELARKQDDPRLALEYAKRSLEIVGGTAGPEEEVAVSLAGWGFLELEQADESAAMFERLVELRGRAADADEDFAIHAWLMLGRARLQQGRYDAADELFDRVIGLNDGRDTGVGSAAWLGVAKVELARGDLIAARLAFSKITFDGEGAPDTQWQGDFEARANAVAEQLGPAPDVPADPPSKR